VTRARVTACATAWLALALAGCGPPPAPGAHGHEISIAAAPADDKETLGLWHLDEPAGIRVLGLGEMHLEGKAGRATRGDFGRFGNSRRFSSDNDSFVWFDYTDALSIGPPWTIEAWVYPDDYSVYEASCIVARWTPNANEQSWFLGLVGERRPAPKSVQQRFGALVDLVGQSPVGTMFFAMQPNTASEPRAYFSTQIVETGRWTHVAVTYDGDVVSLYVDGRLDAQYTNTGGIRATQAPLVFGNYIDPDDLTDFQGSLRVQPNTTTLPLYAFEGRIDEVRLSRVVRGQHATGSP
jgi:hypothetical protein